MKGLILGAVLCGSACQTPRPAVAQLGPTTTTVPVAIESSRLAVESALKAVEKREAIVAASVLVAHTENAHQPPSQRTTFISRELQIAVTNLPPPDATAMLAAEQRRVATLTTNLALMERLYGVAISDAQRHAKEIGDATNAVRAAHAVLVAAEAKHIAELEANRVHNQRQLDAALRKADEAKQEAYKERQNLIVRILIGIGGLCVLAGIGLAIATSGASAWRSGIAVFCGGVCFGLAKVISHPWFNTVFVCSLVGIGIAACLYLWRERKQLLESKALEKVVAAAERSGAVKDADGGLTEFGVTLARDMDASHKAVIKSLQHKLTVDEAKAALRSAKEIKP